jgi:glycosyltransferase involved in cell wall biosynthesis
MFKVSVIIPTYNGGKFLPEAIDSALKQSVNSIEIIVVDDGSIDGTPQLLKDYDRQIKYIYQENKGVSAARNRGLTEASGEYIAFLDADDVWLPKKLEKQIALLDDNRNAGFVYCDNVFVDAERRPIADYNRKVELKDGRIDINLFCNFFMITSGVVMRRGCLETIGIFDETLSVGEDYDFFLRLAYHFDALVVREKLFERRVIAESTSRQNFTKNAENDFKTLKTFLQRYPDFYRLHKNQALKRLADFQLNYAYICRENGKKFLSFVAVLHSLRYCFSFRAIKQLFSSLLLCSPK